MSLGRGGGERAKAETKPGESANDGIQNMHKEADFLPKSRTLSVSRPRKLGLLLAISPVCPSYTMTEQDSPSA